MNHKIIKYNSNWRIKALSHGLKINYKLKKLFFLEFRAFEILSNIIFHEMKKNSSFLIRIPICCEIEYKVKKKKFFFLLFNLTFQ